jgi:Kef-type K+ transport system membrane component KefB/mannitol/fructose-specific phosphotransferase system IIA component (Ntr-type)
MTSSEVTVFLLSISIMLFFAKFLGEIFVRLNQSAVIGEILAGIILGPTILGTLFPELSQWMFPGEGNLKTAMDGITILAVVVLLLLSGIEIDLRTVFRLQSSAALTSFIGILILFILLLIYLVVNPGIFGLASEDRLAFALLIGAAITITSFPVILKQLVDLNMLRTPAGYVIISSAMINDLIGWILFGIIIGIAGTAGFNLSAAQVILFIFVFLIIVLFFGRKISNRIVRVIQDKFSYPGSILNFIMIIGFLSAALTSFAGVHAVLGALIAGIAVGDSVHLKEKTRQIIQQFISNIFAPLFFVSIGLRINLIENFNLQMVLFLLFISILAKGFGSAIGAHLGGLDRDDAAAVGFGMSSGNIMGLIAGVTAWQFGLITSEIFAALVITALVFSAAGTPFMKFYFDKKLSLSFPGLLNPDLLLFTNKENKNEIISDLVSLVSSKFNLDRETILAEILQREESTHTGMSNSLAVPHARINYKKPLMAVAINTKGIDFHSFDNSLSKIIVLLLTPKKEYNLQLKLLADIAGRFRDKNKPERIFEIKDKNELISYMKQL